MSPEFSLINKYFNSHSTKAYKGIGDDAALIKKDNNYLWAISTDMLNSDIAISPKHYLYLRRRRRTQG